MPDQPEDTSVVARGTGVVAVIPARGGSKGVPGKNLAPVGGRSLVGRAIEACRASGAIDVIVVSTDDEAIAAEGRRFGATIVNRPASLSGDLASSESAVLHALEVLEADRTRPSVVAFVQCTSPFIPPEALGRAVERVRSGAADSVFAASETFDFLWTRSADGTAHGLNHDASIRLRRQDRVGDWRETGAFYVMSAAGFVEAGHRFFGRTEIEPVSTEASIEIDTPEDLRLARALASSTAGLERLRGVRALVTDFDGVHTDDSAYVGQDGHEMVRVNRTDGHGIKLLREAGLPLLILSTEANAVVARRAEKLGVECLHGIGDKAPVLERWVSDHGLDLSTVAYLGNDINDLGCLGIVGHPIAVADAHPRVLEVAVHVTRAEGGAGAVREVAEAIIADGRADSADM